MVSSYTGLSPCRGTARPAPDRPVYFRVIGEAIGSYDDIDRRELKQERLVLLLHEVALHCIAARRHTEERDREVPEEPLPSFPPAEPAFEGYWLECDLKQLPDCAV